MRDLVPKFREVRQMYKLVCQMHTSLSPSKRRHQFVSSGQKLLEGCSLQSDKGAAKETNLTCLICLIKKRRAA